MPTRIHANPSMESMIRHALVVKRHSSLFLILFSSILAISCGQEVSHEQFQPLIDTTVVEFPEPLADSVQKGIDDYFNELFTARKFNGVGLFYKDGKQFSFAKGLKRFDTTSDSLEITDQFQLASLSKPFTAYAILQLIEKGLVNIDDSVSHFLPCTPYNNITIRHLLTHTSGIGYYAYVTDNLWGSPENMMDNDDLMTMLECQQVPNYFKPEQYFDYCNTNYTLLADIVESITGYTFQEYMEKEVFHRFGMTESKILDVNKKGPLDYAVHGHFPNKQSKLPSYLDGIVGDKGMYSNVDDLLRFYLAMEGKEFVNDSLWREATNPQERYARNLYYGYGWRVKPLNNGDTIIYHNGWWRGYRSYFWMSKKEDKVCIVLTNWIKGGYLNQEEIWLLF